MIREGTLLLGLATLLPFSIALCRMFALSGNAGIGGFTLFPLLACTALWRRQQTMGNGQRARLSIGFQLTTGVLVVLGGSFTCGSSAYFPAALAVAGLPLLATAKRVRIWNVVIAAAFPILAGFFLLWLRLIRVQPGEMLHDSINLAVLLAISTSLSFLLWKKVRTAILRKASLRGDALLHCLGIVSLHLFFQKHLGEGPDFFAAALLGLSLFAASRRFPFRVLGAVSWLPVALACSSGILAGNWQGLDDSETWFLAAGTLVLAHLVTAGHLERIHPSPRTDFLEGKFGFGPPHFASFIAVLAWTLIALAVTMAPWQAAALTGVALLCSALWRWRIIPVIGHLGLGPLTLAFCFAAALTVAANDAPHPAAWMLTTLALTAAGIAANGMILASAVRHILGGRITAGSLLPWLHACGTLLIAFAACTPDRLVSDNLTAVFWGFSAITLFVCGLLAGLRAYRLAGLAGLVLCVGHIFIWDIQDTFYRIIAFFVIGLVMMVIGFLYHRFRDRISAFD